MLQSLFFKICFVINFFSFLHKYVTFPIVTFFLFFSFPPLRVKSLLWETWPRKYTITNSHKIQNKDGRNEENVIYPVRLCK